MAGEQRNKFRKGHLVKGAKNPYQDPTYLTFQIMFDTQSPLFNKEVAVKALKDQYGDQTRSDKLKSFVDTILMLNKEMPWYWVSLTGVERAMDPNMLEPYKGGSDSKLEILCNESINLAITGLMDMYRNAVYDLDSWTQVLPKNYRRFNMNVIVSEVRDINVSVPMNGGLTQKTINSDITADNKPMFMINFSHCEFVPGSGKEAFESLNSAAPENPAPKITITYRDFKTVSAQYLQGISDVVITDGPGVGNESKPGGDLNKLVKSTGDRLAQSASDAVASFNNDIQNLNPSKIINNPGNVYGSLLDRAAEDFVRGVDNTLQGIASTPGNLFKDGISKTGKGIDSFKDSIKANIFGAEGATIKAALDQGAINSILPMINNVGAPTNLGNIHGK